MNWEAVQSIWPMLAFLGFLLVTMVLKILAVQRIQEVEIHKRIRESKQARMQYEETVQAKPKMLDY